MNGNLEIYRTRGFIAMVEKKEDAQIAVIGAGIAGLCAADSLINRFGFKNVRVYEALDRIGGRIFTSKFGR